LSTESKKINSPMKARAREPAKYAIPIAAWYPYGNSGPDLFRWKWSPTMNAAGGTNDTRSSSQTAFIACDDPSVR
jgi:hypothetical protein